MKNVILLFCLLGPVKSLIQINPALGLPPISLVPDQATLNQQQSNQVFSSVSLIPLTQMLALGSDLQLLNSPAGITPATQTLPLSLGKLNGQQPLQPHMLPVIVAQLGTQGTILSSEELPVASQLFTGLILQPLVQGAILSKSQINPDIQNGVIPAGQSKPNPDLQGTTEIPFSTPSGIDDDFGVTTPAGIQRGFHLTEETTTESPDAVSCIKVENQAGSKAVAFYNVSFETRHMAGIRLHLLQAKTAYLVMSPEEIMFAGAFLCRLKQENRKPSREQISGLL
ncbi:amelotin [Suncus etruscus]|uniref:amelotin n=1 Tax=Suncus etruscus TaxID=109475 RepID=UPI00210F6E76|nr:amelotin [Suncus etruscus]